MIQTHSAIVLLSLVAVASASAQEIIGIDSLSGNVIAIDTKTGGYSTRGSTGLNGLIWTSMARDSQGRLIAGYVDWIGLSGSDLYEIDPVTARATYLVSIPFAGLNALAFDSADRLYALIEQSPGTSFSPEDLYLIDLSTGGATLVGSTGLTVFNSLVSSGGMLWGYDGVLGLVLVNPSDGSATDVNPDFRGPLDLTESLCFSDHGVMYQVDAGLWVQDTLTGVPVFVGPLNYPGILGAVEYLPGPSSPFALGTLGETGGPMGAQAWGATPLGTVVLLRAQGTGGPTPVPSGNPCAGTLLDLNATVAPMAVLRADAQGFARVGPVRVPAAAAIVTHLQALDLATCATSNPAWVLY